MWFEVATNLISAVTSAGVGTVVGHIVESNTPVDIKRTTRFLSKVGAVAITAILSDMASKKVENDLKELGKEIGLIDDEEDIGEEKEIING